MKSIKLSICICGLHDRIQLLSELLRTLSMQDRFDEEVEVLVQIDAGQQTVGVKRNHLMYQAVGTYTVFIDDDDTVSLCYIPKILAAIDENPYVDAIAVRGRRTDVHGIAEPITFDYKLMSGSAAETDKDGVLWRSPGHICPIRTSLSRAVSFPEKEPEDLVRCEEIRPYIRTIARAGAEGEVLYHYRWDSQKTYRWG